MTTYVLTQKNKNKKYIVAKWQTIESACLAVAHDLFKMKGYDLKSYQVDYLEVAESQKMFAGEVAGVKTFYDTIESINKWSMQNHVNTLVNAWGKDKILKLYPEYAEYIQ